MLRRAMLAGLGGVGLSQAVRGPALASRDPNLLDACYGISPSPGTEWWESASIGVVDPADPEDGTGAQIWIYSELKPGYAYKWLANIDRIADCRGPASASLSVELWVGNPALAMAPGVNTVLVASDTTANLPSTSTWFAPSDKGKYWTPTADPAAVNGPGHRCMIVRCYPIGQPPDQNDFHLPDDPHVAQHNISIAQARSASFQFAATTALPRSARAGPVTLRATALRTPPVELLRRMRPALARAGVQQAAAPPRGGV